MRTARVLVMAIAVAAFTMLVASGPGTRMGLWPWETGLSLVEWATYTGLAAGIGGLGVIPLAAGPRGRGRGAGPAVAPGFAGRAGPPARPLPSAVRRGPD